MFATIRAPGGVHYRKPPGPAATSNASCTKRYMRRRQSRRSGAGLWLLIGELFRFFLDRTDRLPQPYSQQVESEPPHRVVCDYIAGMTERLLLPDLPADDRPSLGSKFRAMPPGANRPPRVIRQLHVPDAVELQQPPANLVRNPLRLLIGCEVQFHFDKKARPVHSSLPPSNSYTKGMACAICQTRRPAASARDGWRHLLGLLRNGTGGDGELPPGLRVPPGSSQARPNAVAEGYRGPE